MQFKGFLCFTFTSSIQTLCQRPTWSINTLQMWCTNHSSVEPIRKSPNWSEEHFDKKLLMIKRWRNKIPGPSPYLDLLIHRITFLNIVLDYSQYILNMLRGLHHIGISRKMSWTFIKVTHKSNLILWLHPSSDNLALTATGHQISSLFSHILKAEATKNNIPEYVSSFIDQDSLIYFIRLKSNLFCASHFQRYKQTTSIFHPILGRAALNTTKSFCLPTHLPSSFFRNGMTLTAVNF